MPTSMGARRWILADVAAATVGWWKIVPTAEAPTAVPELVAVSAGPDRADDGTHYHTEGHTEDATEDADADGLPHDLADHSATRPADGPQRADLPHSLGDARQREQRGDQKGGQQHDDGQGSTQVGRQGVGVGEAAGYRLASDLEVRIWAPGSSLWMAAATAVTSEDLATLTNTSLTRPVFEPNVCNVDRSK